jgi:hypothetical protein
LRPPDWFPKTERLREPPEGGQAEGFCFEDEARMRVTNGSAIL